MPDITDLFGTKKTVKAKNSTPFEYEYMFDDKSWQSKNNPGGAEQNWSVPYVPPDIQGSAGRYGFGRTAIPRQEAYQPAENSQGQGGAVGMSDERRSIMDSIKRRSLETVPDYIYNTEMPQQPSIERQIEGRSASGAGLQGNVTPESQVQEALRRLMMRRG